jgi:hypothetical protein
VPRLARRQLTQARALFVELGERLSSATDARRSRRGTTLPRKGTQRRISSHRRRRQCLGCIDRGHRLLRRLLLRRAINLFI